MTVDHVIAAAWYPTNVPANFQRYTVKACLTCNGRFGKLEQDLLQRLAFCLPAPNPAVLGTAAPPGARSNPPLATGRSDPGGHRPINALGWIDDLRLMATFLLAPQAINRSNWSPILSGNLSSMP
jgi:hypothetical protein